MLLEKAWAGVVVSWTDDWFNLEYYTSEDIVDEVALHYFIRTIL